MEGNHLPLPCLAKPRGDVLRGFPSMVYSIIALIQRRFVPRAFVLPSGSLWVSYAFWNS